MLIILCSVFAKSLQDFLGLESTFSMLFLYFLLVAAVFFLSFYRINSLPILWLGLSLSVLAYILYEWPGTANHTYLYWYLCTILFIALNQPRTERKNIFQQNTRYLLLITMLLAVLQKVTTPAYIDGSINSFWLVNGGYGKPIYTFLENWSSIVNENHSLLNRYYNETSYQVDEIKLISPVSNLRLWGQVVAIAIIIGEILVGCFFMWSKSTFWRHFSLQLFIVVVFLMRQEAGFLCLLCIIGLSNCESRNRIWRNLYFFLFALMQIAVLLDYGFI